MLRIATFGPSGTNHELVTRRYLAFHGITAADVVLYGTFVAAVESLKAGAVDYVLQCAVHPETPHTLGRNFRDIFAVDCFISDSKQLAIVTRRDVETPRSIGVLRPANEHYTDLGRWENIVSYASLPTIFAKLLEGEVDSALVYKEYAETHPEKVRIDEVIGSPDDVWIVYGRERLRGAGILAWRESPIGTELRRKAGVIR